MGASDSRAASVERGTRALLDEKLAQGKISPSEYQHMIAVLNRGDGAWSTFRSTPEGGSIDESAATAAAAVEATEAGAAQTAPLCVSVSALSAAIGGDGGLKTALQHFGVSVDALLEHYFFWHQQEMGDGVSPPPLEMDAFLSSAFATIAEHDPTTLASSDVEGAEVVDEEEALERTVAAGRAVVAFATRLWADVGALDAAAWPPPAPAAAAGAGAGAGVEAVATASDERSGGGGSSASAAAAASQPESGRKSMRLEQFLLARKRRAEDAKAEAAAAAAAAAETGTETAVTADGGDAAAGAGAGAGAGAEPLDEAG